jgi:hypothetical protein
MKENTDVPSVPTVELQTYINCPRCGWMHDSEGMPIGEKVFCDGCHEPFMLREESQEPPVKDALSIAADGLAEALRDAKQGHLVVEDAWYNCPASKEGSPQYGDDETECLCGADEINAKIDKALATYEKAKKSR